MVLTLDWGAIVGRANLAPSVHNTQPTRWAVSGNRVVLSLEPGRLLAVGDPAGHDARFSLGAAWRATGLGVAETGGRLEEAGRRRAVHGAQIEGVAIEGGTERFETAAARRFTWRGGFAPATSDQAAALRETAAAHGATLVSEVSSLTEIAERNDSASLDVFRNRPYRAELLAWMRLRRGHRNWSRDGLNAEALGLSRIEALGAGVVLRDPAFSALDRLGLGGALTSERTKTLSATGVLLFHRPREEDPLDSGAIYFDLLLALTSKGLATWPMAVLADDPVHNAALSRAHWIPDDRRLINALRVGPLPPGARPGRARLPVSDVLKLEQ